MEILPDPINDRVIKEVLPPPQKRLNKEKLYDENNTLNLKIIKDHLLKEGKFEKNELLEIINKVSVIFKKEPNILKVKDPVVIVGDIHGQYYDLISLLELGGEISNTQYLFLGDYVDRGSFSVEVLILLYAAKINFPETIWLMRGNHECRQLTSYFNFKHECEVKYDIEIYNAFMNSFDTLPIACIVNNKFACIHGGISPNIDTVSKTNLFIKYYLVFCN
jgi:serine/threonine-protein phosphatase 2B catalytic subunit